MASAIFGIVGVVIGGLLTAGLEEWRAWRAERIRRRLAARLLFDELGWYRTAFEVDYEAGLILETTKHEELTRTWAEQRDALRTIPREEWFRIHTAVRHATTFAEDLAARAPGAATASPAEIRALLETEAMQPVQERIDAAATVLARYC